MTWMRLSSLSQTWSCALSVALIAAIGAVFAPGIAVADTLSLAINTEPVQDAPLQVTYTGEIEGGDGDRQLQLDLNPADVPCASAPEQDSGGSILRNQDLQTEPQSEAFTGTTSFEPSQTGALTICGWVTDIVGEPVGSASLPIEVRPPHISLTLSLPRPPVAGKSFTLDLLATSEVTREAIVVGVPDTPAGCPAGPAAAGAIHLIDTTIAGGPVLKHTTVKGLPAGSHWIFCAWATVPGESTPQASSSLVAEIQQTSSTSRGHGHGHKHATPRERACGTVDFGQVITATVRASGISCAAARRVVRVVEQHTHLPADVVHTPYYKYSPPYSAQTPAGHFTCRREPFGLAGSEHNIRCERTRPLARVRWFTSHK